MLLATAPHRHDSRTGVGSDSCTEETVITWLIIRMSYWYSRHHHRVAIDRDETKRARNIKADRVVSKWKALSDHHKRMRE